MKLWAWEDGRQKSGYRKLTLLFSTFFGVDAYILHIPAGAFHSTSTWFQASDTIA